MIKIISLNTGRPQQLTYGDGKRLRTTLRRTPASDRIFLDYLGFEGDQVADPVNHGGPDKAVCGYPADHYPFWQKELGRTLPPSAFGENLTLNGLTEDDIHIGDIFQFGEAEIQFSQPRQPCHKLTKIFEYPKLASRIQSLGYCGYYFRVLKQGWIQGGITGKRIHEDSAGISVLDAHHLMYRDKNSFDAIEQLIRHPALSDAWKNSLRKRLAKKDA